MFGILNLYKSSGPTSRDCVNSVQKLTKPDRVGHGGTLDPLASGVLVLLVGQAVRLTDAVHELSKEYVGTFQLDCTSESADNESEVSTVVRSRPICREDLIQAFRPLIGLIPQKPPTYSAIRINGRRAHDLARAGKEFDVPERMVAVESIELVEFSDPMFRIRVRCGSGTYIRSLGRDIARSLGSDAVMVQLERTAVGPFRTQDAVSLEQLDSSEAIERVLRSARDAVPDWEQRTVSDALLMRIHQGKSIDASDLELQDLPEAIAKVAILDERGELRALMKRIQSQLWRTDKGFLVDTTKV